jgi:hypothetical protein
MKMKRYKVTITLTIDSTASEKDVEKLIDSTLPSRIVSQLYLLKTINKRISIFQTESTHEQIQPD